MINISGTNAGAGAIDESWLANPVAKVIVDTMRRSRSAYSFASPQQLNFRLELGVNIVAAARGLNQSDVSFATFYDSRCDERYWNLTANGGFQLKANAPPAGALRDIYSNGRAYAFECATAMVILLYKAVLDSIGDEAFNRNFSSLLLWDWEFDEDLGLTWETPTDYFPGDVRYFKNPDVNPIHMQWQGENVIDLGNGTYYGHGLGIRKAEEVVIALNQNRKPGAHRSAFLMEEATRPNFNNLSRFAETRGDSSGGSVVEEAESRKHFVTVHVGDSVHVY